MGTTVITIEDVRALEVKEEQEESILAMLGIIGTFLNLFVIVFVYIYTTLWSTKLEDSGFIKEEKLNWAVRVNEKVKSDMIIFPRERMSEMDSLAEEKEAIFPSHSHEPVR